MGSRLKKCSHPWQNGYIESFNARLKEEWLNRE
ncbi:MAG TPA: hypothetical protein DCF72_07365 [Gammaproteobacteria bacterium]|nr:MAG: hypothetical protein COC21_05305 [Verrucomicrobiales bacterium]HAD36744.1 hypothetical protein [Gammaproteobacteria bacterium]